MEFVKTFEGFLNESALNEGTNFGDITAAIGGGDEKTFDNFINKVKKGDTFDYAPNGVELLYLPDGEIDNVREIDVEIKQTSRDAKPVKCKVLGTGDGVYINDPSGDYEDEQSVVYFTIQGDRTVYVLVAM